MDRAAKQRGVNKCSREDRSLFANLSVFDGARDPIETGSHRSRRRSWSSYPETAFRSLFARCERFSIASQECIAQRERLFFTSVPYCNNNRRKNTACAFALEIASSLSTVSSTSLAKDVTVEIRKLDLLKETFLLTEGDIPSVENFPGRVPEAHSTIRGTVLEEFKSIGVFTRVDESV